MLNLVLSWRGLFRNPSWEQVMAALLEAKKLGGIMRLDIVDAEPGLPDGFDVEMDEDVDLYRPVMSIKGSGLRYYENKSAGSGFVEFGGGDLRAGSLSDDFNLMIKMAREFYETGDVKVLKNPEDLLYNLEQQHQV